MTSGHKTDYENSIVGTGLWWLRSLLRLVMMLVMFCVTAMTVAIIHGKYALAPGTAIEHMQGLIGYVLDRTTNQEFARALAAGLYWLCFKWNGIHDAATEYDRGGPAWTLMSDLIRRTLIIPFNEPLMIAMLSVKLFGIRMAGLLQALPLFILTCVLAAIDGLSERYIRRCGLGRESAAIYHRAKHYAFRLLPPLAGFVYLVLPYPMEPAMVFMPVALMTGLLLRTQMKYYKKYM